jgi:two-component system, NtrC family, response regulator AtoC
LNSIDTSDISEASEASEALRGRFLIVDDEEHIREILRATLEPLALSIHDAGTAEEALELVREENLDMVICDIQMPGMNGLDFLSKVKSEQPSVKFLMITAHGTMDTAVKALRYGASDFLTKPFENEEIRNIARRLLRERKNSSDSIPAVIPGMTQNVLEGIIGKSPALLACLDKARKAAVSDTTVLLTGESGTGKEVVSRAIHNLSKRSEKPFIAVNCGAIPENLLESELFGHEKGAFTGAIASKPGKFTLADGGTIFLDEIGEMPMLMQVKLLRVIQERIVEPVGSTRTLKVDFRLIAATNRNLKEEIKQGRFREDLYYRLNIIPIDLPPLRDREGDVLLLARNFLAYYNERYACKYSLNAENERDLKAYDWPGNVRELANAIERAVVLASGDTLSFALSEASVVSQPGQKAGLAIKEKKQAVEREEILKSLEANRWNKTQTAESLGMSRRSLLYKIKEFSIA